MPAQNSPARPRLGRIELKILDELIRQGGLTQREAMLAVAFPEVGKKPDPQGRAKAEAALSRAIQSLVRKKLLVSQRNPQTGRTLLRAVAMDALPEWEEIARAEEDLAVHCRKLAREWQQLATRASRRAERIRAERSLESTEADRQHDLDLVARLESGGTP